VAVLIGTAGWSIPISVADRFPGEGSALERYSTNFAAVEINSSFHRSHRLGTWERWRNSVPEGFRFSVKLPKTITHTRKLADMGEDLDAFLEQAQMLGDKLGVLLVQLPPKLAFDAFVSRQFFAELAARTTASIACEPRHVSWFGEAAEILLQELGIARVGADPYICESAVHPGQWGKLSYWRLHGSPVIYRSSYADRIPDLATKITRETERGRDVWCIFDNTASSAAAPDALALTAALAG
jgi:uncharacterized protein YecE (DUF72 family)